MEVGTPGSLSHPVHQDTWRGSEFVFQLLLTGKCMFTWHVVKLPQVGSPVWKGHSVCETG